MTVIIDFNRGRVLLRGQLCEVGSMLQQLLQAVHGQEVLQKIDLTELGALAQGSQEGFEMRNEQPSFYMAPVPEFAGYLRLSQG